MLSCCRLLMSNGHTNLVSPINQTLTVLLVTPHKNIERLLTKNTSVVSKSSTGTKIQKTSFIHVKTKPPKPLINLKDNILSTTSTSQLEVNQQILVSKEDAIPAINLEHIMENAREIAHQEAQQLEKNEHSKDNVTTSKSIVSAVLSNAFKSLEISGQQKIRSFADGMWEITNSDGSKYCLLPTKDFQRGGSAGAQSVPMTCP